MINFETDFSKRSKRIIKEIKTGSLFHQQGLLYFDMKGFKKVAFCFGRRASKSFFLENLIISYLFEGKRVLYITHKASGADNMMNSIVARLGGHTKNNKRGEVIKEYNKNTRRLKLNIPYRNSIDIKDTEFMCIVAGDLSSKNSELTAGRGEMFDAVFVDEAGVYGNLKSILATAQPTMATALNGDEKFIVVGTVAKNKDHYFYEILHNKALGFRAYKAPTMINPYVSKSFIENLKELSPAIYRREILCEWDPIEGEMMVSAEKLKENNIVHLTREEIARIRKILIFIDPAYTSNKKSDATGVVAFAILNNDEGVEVAVLIDYDKIKTNINLLSDRISEYLLSMNDMYPNAVIKMFIETKGGISKQDSGKNLLELVRSLTTKKYKQAHSISRQDFMLQNTFFSTERYYNSASLPKAERISSAIYLLATNQVFIWERAWEKDVLYEEKTQKWLQRELLEYDYGVRSQQDDVVDAFAQGLLCIFEGWARDA